MFGQRLVTVPVIALLAALPAALPAALTGCGSSQDGAGEPGIATVAAFYPLGWVAQRVGGDHVSVELLTGPGVEPHDVELSPQQVAQVADAEMLVVERGFQPAVDDVVEQEADVRVVDAADVVRLVPDAEGGTDPHFWLDPTRMAGFARAVAAGYAEVDPTHAASYRRAADVLAAELRRLDRDYTERLTGCRTDTLVTGHDAFGYLAERYGMTVLPITGVDPGSEPSPERLAELTGLVRTHDVTTVFTETLVSPAVAATLADEAGVEVATLDPIEGLTDATAGEDYLSLMRSNLDTLARANGC